MKIGVYGVGAVGGAVASMLYNCFPYETYLLAPEDKYDKLIRGIVVNKKKYKINVTKCDDMDFIFVCLKNYNLEDSLDDLSLFITEKTVIVPLLNSIIARDVIQDYFPNNNVLYGLIRIEAQRDSKNKIIFGKLNGITFGEETNGEELTDDVFNLKVILDECKIPNFIEADMKRAVWLKWMLNIGINQVSALTNATYKDMHHPELQILLFQLFMEVVAIAQKMNVNITEQDAKDTLAKTLTWDSSRFTSLAQDFQNKRRNELDYFGKLVIDLGKKYNVPTPANDVIYKCLAAITDRYMNE